MGADEWEKVVDDMIARGARGSNGEARAVVEYLAKNLGKPAR
jgi:hypothetical protein